MRRKFLTQWNREFFQRNREIARENRVKVTEWSFAPGAETGRHRHDFDYVVVPLTDGKLLLKDSSGERYADLVTGRSYARHAGVEHNMINTNTYPFRFIEIEIK